jgi:hypothetical protein
MLGGKGRNDDSPTIPWVRGRRRDNPVISSLLGQRRGSSLQLLIARGADLTIRARVPGYHERPGEVLDVSGAEYCAIFPLR